VGVGAANASPVAVRRWNMTGGKRRHGVPSVQHPSAMPVRVFIIQYREGTGTEGTDLPVISL
jgi:hypothetical protein